MRILLDQQPCLPDAATVREALAGAAAIAEEHGRVVVEVVVDGAPWGDAELASTALCDGSAGEISLVSTDLKELVCRALDDASDALVMADEIQRKAAELIQSDRQTEAMQQLGAAIGIWQTVQQTVVRSAEAFALDIETLEIGDGPMTAVVSRLGAQLGALQAGLHANNPVGMSDALLYDLPDVVAEWREVLQVLKGHVEEAPSLGATEANDGVHGGDQ